MGFPKIPDSEEIAAMVAGGMEPMMTRLDRLIELLEEQNRMLAQPRAS